MAGTSDPAVATYRYAKSAFSMVATPTTAVVIAGAAGKVIRVKRVTVSGAATAAGSMPVTLERWSTAGTLGSAVLTAVAAAKKDSAFGTAGATVSTVGTANYTTKGTTAGLVSAGRLTMVALGSAATSGEGKPLVLHDLASPSVVLRSALELLVIDFGGAAIPAGGVLDFEIETQEDSA